jgi:hypothetical protein
MGAIRFSINRRILFMTESEAVEFVAKLGSVWGNGVNDAFTDVWHPDGMLEHPMLDEQLRGVDIPSLQLAGAPDLKVEIIGWTWREDVVVVEWSVRRSLSGHEFSWQGLEKITLRDGKILKEVVYSDTAPLRALRRGKTVEPMMKADEIRASKQRSFPISETARPLIAAADIEQDDVRFRQLVQSWLTYPLTITSDDAGEGALERSLEAIWKYFPLNICKSANHGSG